MRKYWSEEEVRYLRELYENNGFSVSEIYPLFNSKYNRTLEAISVKIGKLKLKHSKEQTYQIKSRLNSGENNAMFGKVSPLKGKTKENSQIVRIKSEKLAKTRIDMFKSGTLPSLSGENNPMYGSTAWNNGKTKFNDERILKYSEKLSEKAKLNWSKKTDEEKQIIINRLNKAMIQNRKPTIIELKIKDLLIDESIDFIKNHRINNFLVDFYLPKYNLVVECDGDYWHANPLVYKDKTLDSIQLKNIDRDKRKEIMLKDNNIKIIRCC
jgi:very-short-patch-repair endonuclease